MDVCQVSFAKWKTSSDVRCNLSVRDREAHFISLGLVKEIVHMYIMHTEKQTGRHGHVYIYAQAENPSRQFSDSKS